MKKRVRSISQFNRIIACLKALVILALFKAVYSPVQLKAQETTPAEVKVSTPAYYVSAGDLAQRFGTYTYTVSWQGIPAATLTLAVEPEGQYYRVLATAKTYKAIDLFYKLRYEAEGIISAVNLLPQRTTIHQTENSKRKFTEISFLDSGEVQSYRRTDDKQPDTLKFDPGNFMLEPISAAFIARALPWNLGETKEFDTFNGKSRYLISMTAIEKIKMRVNEETRDVFVFEPKVYNLVNAEQSKKLRKAKIYVTADDRRELLQVVSSVFIGSVYTRLDSFTPSTKGPAGVQVAQTHKIFIK